MPTDAGDLEDSGARTRKAIERLQANPKWSAIRMELLLHAYKINGYSRRGIDDFVQEGIARFVADPEADLAAVGVSGEALALLKKKVGNARDRHRQSKATQTSRPLAPHVIEAMSDGATHPEKMLMENRSRTNWESYVARVEALAAPHPCGKLLMEGFDLGEGDARARAAGFTQAEINNERKRLKRFGKQAALELGIDVPAENDEGEGEPA